MVVVSIGGVSMEEDFKEAVVSGREKVAGLRVSVCRESAISAEELLLSDGKESVVAVEEIFFVVVSVNSESDAVFTAAG